MNFPWTRLCHRLRTSLLVIGAVVCCGCDSQPPPATEEAPKRFVYVAPPPPKATHVPEGTGQWLQLLKDLQEQIHTMEDRLEEASAVHRETSFDELLNADLETLGNDQLAYLWHFADKGFFTLEREIMLKLLEDQKSRPTSTVAAPSNIAERAQALSERFEAHLRDLELAVSMYAKTKDVEFHIPNHLDAEQTDILKGMVAEKLAQARDACAAMDARINELKGGTKEPKEMSGP